MAVSGFFPCPHLYSYHRNCLYYPHRLISLTFSFWTLVLPWYKPSSWRLSYTIKVVIWLIFPPTCPLRCDQGIFSKMLLSFSFGAFPLTVRSKYKPNVSSWFGFFLSLPPSSLSHHHSRPAYNSSSNMQYFLLTMCFWGYPFFYLKCNLRHLNTSSLMTHLK